MGDYDAPRKPLAEALGTAIEQQQQRGLDELRVTTPGGRFQVRWDDRGQAMTDGTVGTGPQYVSATARPTTPAPITTASRRSTPLDLLRNVRRCGSACMWVSMHDRGRKDRLSSIPPPSEPYVQISRIRLSGR